MSNSTNSTDPTECISTPILAKVAYGNVKQHIEYITNKVHINRYTWKYQRAQSILINKFAYNKIYKEM